MLQQIINNLFHHEKITLLLFLGAALIASSPMLCAQTAPENPYSFTHKLKKKVATEKLDADKAYQKFLKEKNPFAQDNHYLGQYDTDVKMNLLQHGTWEKLPNGDHLWRIKLPSDSKLLTGIGVHADKSINIPQGAKLFFIATTENMLSDLYNRTQCQKRQTIARQHHTGQEHLDRVL